MALSEISICILNKTKNVKFLFLQITLKKTQTQNNAQPPKKNYHYKKFVCLQPEKWQTNFFQNLKKSENVKKKIYIYISWIWF